MSTAKVTPRLLGIADAAAFLGVSRNHFLRHVAPSVEPVTIGNRRLYDIRSLNLWVDSRALAVHARSTKRELLGALNGDPHERRQTRRQ